MQTNKKNKNFILQFLAVLIVFLGFSCNKSTKVITSTRGELKILEIKNLPEGFSLLNTIDEVNQEFTLVFAGPYQLTVNDLQDSQIITDPEDAKISFSSSSNSIAKVMTISSYGLSKTYQIQTNATLPTPALVEIKNLPKGFSFVKVEHGIAKDANGAIEHKVVLTTSFNELPVEVLKIADFVTFPANIRPEIITSSNNPSIAEALVFEFDGQKTRYGIEITTINLPKDFSIKEIKTNSTEVVLDNPDYNSINKNKLFTLISNKINIEKEVKNMTFSLTDEKGDLIDAQFYRISYEYIGDQAVLITPGSTLAPPSVVVFEIKIKLLNDTQKIFKLAQKLNIILEVIDYGQLTLLNPTTIEEDGLTLKFAENSYGVNTDNSMDNDVLEKELKLGVVGFSEEEYNIEFLTRGRIMITLGGRKWGKGYLTKVVPVL